MAGPRLSLANDPPNVPAGFTGNDRSAGDFDKPPMCFQDGDEFKRALTSSDRIRAALIDIGE